MGSQGSSRSNVCSDWNHYYGDWSSMAALLTYWLWLYNLSSVGLFSNVENQANSCGELIASDSKIPYRSLSKRGISASSLGTSSLPDRFAKTH
jgi:hypothetical protein